MSDHPALTRIFSLESATAEMHEALEELEQQIRTIDAYLTKSPLSNVLGEEVDSYQVLLDHAELWLRDECVREATMNRESMESRCHESVASALLEDLESRYIDSRCGCGHPACKSCRNDEETATLIAWAKGVNLE